jgi:citrate synthase
LHDPSEKYLTGSQAAEFLGVKSSTLYAYVSRGLIESVPAQNARERWYRMTDLIRLRQSVRGFKAVRESEPANWTGPVIKSAITEIRESGHRYRGENALALARSDTPFEAVAELLWETDTESETYVQWKDIKPFTLPARLLDVPADVDILDLLKLLLVDLEMSDTVCRKLNADDVYDTAHSLIVTMAVTVGLSTDRADYVLESKFPIAKTLLAALSGDHSLEKARLINCALVLCADHELNASALAARIAASCDASLYSCLLSALGTFSGSMHGSASRRAEDIVTNSLKFDSVKSWLKSYLRDNERVPGFGTELYSGGDPRARAMIEAAKEIGNRGRNFKRLIEIVDCVLDELDLEPNLDVGLAAISYAISLPPGSGTTIFAISRTAGWIAHAIEQRLYGAVIRPRARYIGRVGAD